MPLSDNDFETLLNDSSKRINGNIEWCPDEDQSSCMEFRVQVDSEAGWPLFVRGSFNPRIPALSFVLILKTEGRIYALDLGKDHHNPDCSHVGECHKHRWSEQLRDKQAYAPSDITAPASRPVEVWEQFCREAHIRHDGRLAPPPPFTEELFL